MNTRNEPQSANSLFFNPQEYPEGTLKAFDEFVIQFKLRYRAQYPDPPKSSLDTALQRWKIEHTTDTEADPKPTLVQYDTICKDWMSKDQVSKFLGMFSAHSVYTDWCVADTDENTRQTATWEYFETKMREYYKPTENQTLKNYHFRELIQGQSETFPSFCNRITKEAVHCYFKCDSRNCTAEQTAIRDQVIIGTNQVKIREEALLKSWDLATLRKEGMKIESALKGGAEIGGEAINRVGAYSFRNTASKGYTNRNSSNDRPQTMDRTQKHISCFNCGNQITTTIPKHKKVCPAQNSKCPRCNRNGHFSTVCRSSTPVNTVTDMKTEEVPVNNINTKVADTPQYNINIFQIGCNNETKSSSGILNKQDFKVQVAINGHITTVIADTGAKISVCGSVQAKQWNLMERMALSQVKIKPYESEPLPVCGVARCAVTFGTISVPVEWHIITGSCDTILAGNKATQLGIVSFNHTPTIFQPTYMIDKEITCEEKDTLQGVLVNFPENFKGLGKLKDYQVKLHVDSSVKPVTVPPRSTPYHLKERVKDAIDEMIKRDIIEEHPTNEPAPWISCAVVTPKPDGDIRVTLDARNINKAIQSTNLPIPRPEDIKAKLGGSKIFSKMDFKSAFWQIELHPDSRFLTVFHADEKLYRYKRLTMGVKPAQGELNTALKPIFAHIPDTHLIHDDLIIATKTMEEHRVILQSVMEAILNAGITLNPDKCEFGRKEIKFWGMIVGSEGIRPDPAKVEALDHIRPPTNKADLLSFLCMMQSVSEFIPNFAKKAAKLRELTKKNARFHWTNEHEKCFHALVQEFRKDALLRYFDLTKPIFIITDAHLTGIGAILCQGDTLETARPVSIVSRTTTPAEARYPQLDLEALGLDFALRRFRNYIIGAPTTVKIITDHKPLCSVYNGNRQGSIRTQRIKQRHQDIRFSVHYQPGKLNQADFLSRNAQPIETLPKVLQGEAEELNNLLYMLHTTPMIDHISLATIAKDTSNDETLHKLQDIVRRGQSWIHKNESEDLRRFKSLLPEITITGNGILLKGDRIILPESLQGKVMELAHRGSHPKQSGIEQRLRYHFFFHNMNHKVEEFLRQCQECQSFDDKKTREPIKPHVVPSKCWETVAVDLFGPMPSSNHIVVVQDLASRFPAAKLVSSTKASKVLPVLGDIYDAYGNPENQLSDNGPPFNSKSMQQFAEKRNINMQNIPPRHPSSNTVETFMKPLGKTMKIANYNKISEKEALNNLLSNYRDTPHPATGIPPAAMLFRDAHQSVFPRKSVSDNDVRAARERDEEVKQGRGDKINSSKYRISNKFSIGDSVLLRNYKRSSKFDPLFLPEPHIISAIDDQGRRLTVERETDGKLFFRHPDDIKYMYTSSAPANQHSQHIKPAENDIVRMWHQIATSNGTDEDSNGSYWHDVQTPDANQTDTGDDNIDQNVAPDGLRRSQRVGIRNQRYFNEDYVNTLKF